MADRAAIIEEWSYHLAEEVSPDEAILAPTMAEAFIAGGKQRRQLFEESSGELGGFGAGNLALIMPAVFSAIAAAGPLLIAALSSPLASNVVKALDNVVDYLALREENRPSGASSAPAPPPPGDPALTPVIKVLETMQSEMRAKGVSAEASEAAAYRSLRTLFAEPGAAKEFVSALNT
jgi:hypothetical protein